MGETAVWEQGHDGRGREEVIRKAGERGWASHTVGDREGKTLRPWGAPSEGKASPKHP